MPISQSIRRWNEEMERRSRRAPAFTLVGSSLLPGKDVEAAHNQCVKRQSAILIEAILLRSQKEFLAAPRSSRIKTQNALDQSICFLRQTVSHTNLRNQADFPGLLRTDWVAK